MRSDMSRIYAKYYTKLASPSVLKTSYGADLDTLKGQIEFEHDMGGKSQKLFSYKTFKPSDSKKKKKK